ncbi:MAG: hypothetical protein ACLRSW_15940 [Christensenellaceae bacterium]
MTREAAVESPSPMRALAERVPTPGWTTFVLPETMSKGRSAGGGGRGVLQNRAFLSPDSGLRAYQRERAY